MAGSDKVPSQQDDDALAARSLSRVPRVPLIVGSTLLLLLLAFLTAVAVREDDVAARPYRSSTAGDRTPPPGPSEAAPASPEHVRARPHPAPARGPLPSADAPRDALGTPPEPARGAAPAGPAQVGLRRAPITAGAPADPATGVDP